MKDTPSCIFKRYVVKVYIPNQGRPCFIIKPSKLKVIVSQEGAEKRKKRVSGEIADLQVLEGNESFLQSAASANSNFILCWEVKENRERKWKKLVNVTFPNGLNKSGGPFLADDFRTRRLKTDKPHPKL